MYYWRNLPLAVLTGIFLIPRPALANVLQVGPGKPYARPCAAILAAAPGDTIEIDTSGNYSGDVCAWSTNDLTIRGVGPGRAVLDAAGQNAQGKGIWVIAGNNTTVENIEFTGASVPDLNGAGIRQEGANLTVRNCYFHNNQEGILAGDGLSSTILIEYSEFGYNGAGDGQSHNVYINNVGKLIFRYNYSHHSIVGHLLKSRAAENDILYNRLTDEATGTGSYEIDLPNGGKSYIIGNLVEQGPQTGNNTIVSFLEEGRVPGNPDNSLFFINNSVVNDHPSGSNTFLYIDPSDPTPAIIANNIFVGPGTLTTQSNAVLSHNFVGNPLFVDLTNFDYHLTANSPAVNAGVDPGSGEGIPLAPVYQYIHPACAEGRTAVGAIDEGAYELNGGTGVAPPLAPSRCSSASPAPAANLSPASLSFGNQTVGTTSAAQNVTLTNSGSASLTISGITTAGDFAQTNNCGSSLAANGSCTIRITFTPTATGTRTGTMSVTHNAAGSPQTVSLTGSGVAPSGSPAVVLSPTNLTFVGQIVGTSSGVQNVTLTNSGSGTLSISNIATSGDFSQTSACGATVLSGANCTISISFRPTAGGPRGGALSVSDNAPGSPQTVSLSGTGADFSLSASSNSATISAGQSASFTVVVTPDGGFSQAITFACSGAPPAATCAVSPSSLMASGSSASSATVTISTTARTLLPPADVKPFLPMNGRRLEVFHFCLLLTLALLLKLWKPVGKPRFTTALGALLFLIPLSGCSGLSGSRTPPGGGGSGTPPGTSTITVTGTSGSLNHSLAFTLKVS